MDYQDELLLDVSDLAHYVRRPSYFAANGFYWAVAVAFALMQAGLAPLYWLLSAVWDVDPNGFTVAAQVFLYLGVILLPLVLYICAHPAEREAFRLRRASMGQNLLSLLVAGFGFWAANFITILWMVLLEQFGLNPARAAADAFSGSLPLDLIMIALLPAVCEEIMFRGLILGAYERRGTSQAILISALLFAGLHGSVSGLPAHLMIGAALGFTAVSTGSLLPPMVLHAAYNAITVISAYSAPAANDISATMLEQLGGAVGVAAAIIGASVCIALFLASLGMLDKLRQRDGCAFGMGMPMGDTRLSRSELILLISGVVTVIWFYVENLLIMI